MVNANNPDGYSSDTTNLESKDVTQVGHKDTLSIIITGRQIDRTLI